MTAPEKRIAAVLGDDDNGKTLQNALRHLAYLKAHLKLPVRVTEIEDFSWEEPYVIGGWDQDEYEELKKTNPSYTDNFDLQDIRGPESGDLVAFSCVDMSVLEAVMILQAYAELDRKINGNKVVLELQEKVQ
jgi:hypothetical protein